MSDVVEIIEDIVEVVKVVEPIVEKLIEDSK